MGVRRGKMGGRGEEKKDKGGGQEERENKL